MKHLKLAYKMARESAGRWDDDVCSAAHMALVKFLKKCDESYCDKQQRAFLRSLVRTEVRTLLRKRDRVTYVSPDTLSNIESPRDDTGELLQSLPHGEIVQEMLKGYTHREVRKNLGISYPRFRDMIRQNREAVQEFAA